MQGKSKVVLPAIAGAMFVIIFTVVNALPVLSQEPLPPSESEGVRISVETDKAIYSKGEVAQLKIVLTNSGTTEIKSGSLQIGYDIVKNEQTVLGYRVFKDYAAEKPFILRPQTQFDSSYEWPLVMYANATALADAEPGTYTIRAVMLSPVEISSETKVEVRDS